MGRTDSATEQVGSIPTDALVEMYSRMMLIRTFELGAERLHTEGILSGPFHSSVGQEAVAVGVCSVLRPEDVITSTHRGHGHLIAKGADPSRMLAELAGRRTGNGRGKSGSMHLADLDVGAIGENGVVGASIFIGTGAALGFQLEGSDRVAAVFFGDGAVGQGILYECLNLASIWSLPVVFICEDNQYAHSFASKRLANGADIIERTLTFGIPAARVEGRDAIEVRLVAEAAVARAMAGEGPSLIQADCYRWKGHNLGDAHHLYRPRTEVSEARTRDPLDIMRAQVLARAPDLDIDQIRRGAEERFSSAWDEARRAPAADPGAIFDDLPA
jgi:acetoin:2,6-dichlorophenolindophenol oxidoreductase subunit alpha